MKAGAAGVIRSAGCPACGTTAAPMAHALRPHTGQARRPTPIRPRVPAHSSRRAPARGTRDGQCPLTDTELRVLAGVMDGLSYQEIAEQLGRATSTVRSHTNNALARLGVTSSCQAVLECVRQGWLTWSDTDPLAAILLRIEQLFIALAERDAEALTASQREYLEMFDRHVQATTEPARQLSRRAMDVALSVVLEEADIVPHSSPAASEVLEVLGDALDQTPAARDGHPAPSISSVPSPPRQLRA